MRLCYQSGSRFGRKPLNSIAPKANSDEIRLAMTGDNDAIRLWIQQWYRRVYAQCQAMLISQADAEDATQETFLRGISRMHELRSAASVGSWLRGIAHHVCVDTVRRKEVRKTTRQPVEQCSPSSADDPQDCVQRDEQTRHLVGLIHKLPESLREVILLHYYDEMTYDEMAQWLGVARSTVNERLGKARKLLRRELLPQRGCLDEL